jgi:hypothetical protein
VGLRELMKMAPPVEFDPTNVPCGPRSTSALAMS